MKERWYSDIRLYVKALLWFSFLFTVFRCIFIGIYGNESLPWADIGLCLWYGFRISLKTIGIILVVPFLLTTLVGLVSVRWPRQRLQNGWFALATFVTTLLFMVRIPYYAALHANFNNMVLNGLHDDWTAIWDTAIYTYKLWLWGPLGIIIGVAIAWSTIRILRTSWGTIRVPVSYPRVRLVLSILAVPVVAVLLRFGGSFTYTNSIHWESANRTSSTFLNETILDDAQALYRVWSIYQRMESTIAHIDDAAGIETRLARVGTVKAHTIDGSFERTITQAMLPEQPRAVYVVIGESYGAFPYYDRFQQLGSYIAQEGKAMGTSAHGTMATHMLAFSNGTAGAVNGWVTGLPYTPLATNYEPISYKEVYGTSFAVNMKRFGYRTIFWYGGYSGWQNIKAFTLAQGFDTYYDASDFSEAKGNAWGATDGELMNAIIGYNAAHPKEKVCHVILTVSNHPPYSVNVVDAGFDQSKALTGEVGIPTSPKGILEIGHYWYADHVVGDMVKRTDDGHSLYIITGDHSERFSFTADVTKWERSGVPLILYGKGYQLNEKNLHDYGTALQMLPTIYQLVGRPGQTYMAMMPSLWETEMVAFDKDYWIKNKQIEPFNTIAGADKQYADDLMNIALYRIRKGNRL